MATLITDHPAWTTHDDGTATRAMLANRSAWQACWSDGTLELHPLGEATRAPRVVQTSGDQLPPGAPAALRTALGGLERVVRLPNPDLWDAITTAVLRQVVRAAQARALYRRWCAAYGTRDTVRGPVSLTPAPEVVLDLPEEAFREIGAAFHRTALQAAATTYLQHADEWHALDPDDLVKALDDIPRVGPWTASAATADFTGDFSVYPHGDLAVRTWARRAAPTVPLPDSEREFAAAWQRYAPDRHHLHALTLFTLAWGTHARTAEHNGAPADRT
ncbi:hypothetical protein [Streptantibioticus ferralitis]|uniref:DNA-3-methyladenine glycosylase II n=1 Tax=Streptantibioticus ferralitis TaxID=236510 RepID=A0ABT5Z0G2_9ACTN|nr:hypothetical protein [Streptantibioticus ferralitis]MDF2257321.1 hypothetical protein [Streptantibioticus ferralitis]